MAMRKAMQAIGEEGGMIGNENAIGGVPRLAIVLPCFNESESIDHAVTQLTALIFELVDAELISNDSCLFFVDDGSTDDSWAVIEEFNRNNKAIKGLKLSRNFGHQAALLAGLTTVTKGCDAAVSIDADLQQDPLAIREFVKEFKNGADVVLGVRRDRGTDGWFKKQTALGFYKLMGAMGVNTFRYTQVPKGNDVSYEFHSKEINELGCHGI